ncbi:Ig-like domain-containing protein [Vulcanococcus limneticus]|uniref:Ig-like domain-containing protein n=1 Tax=Vulcanococcus limneticus TaxID=2170428 RepID=UPI00398C0603
MAIPSLVELAVDGTMLALRYSEVLNSILPSSGRFQVSVNGIRRSITGPAMLRGGGTTIRLNLATPILATDTVAVTYVSVNGFDRTGFGDIRSLSTYQTAAFFRNFNATNLTGIANSVTINSNDSSIITGETALISFAFSRNPGTSFNSGDVSVSGGSLSDLSGSSSSYSATFTPTANTEGTASIAIATGSWHDIFENAGAGAVSSTLQIDTFNPAVAILFAAPAINDIAKSALVSFSFSEKVVGFSGGDISVTNGTLSGFTGYGNFYSAIFTAQDGIATTGTFSIAANSYTDIAGNAGSAAFDLVSIDTLNPTPALVPPGSDPILIWTNTALNAIQSAGSNGKPGVPPTTGSRLMAMLSTAMLDTLAAFGDEVDFYRIDQSAPAGANMDAALLGAAQRILSLELPGETSLIQEQYTSSLQSLAGSAESIEEGLAFGAGMADQIRALRTNDGSANTTPYSPPSGGLPGYVWTPAPSGPTAGAAVGPNWGSVTPWVISSPDAYRSDGLQCRPDVDLDLYAQQLNEVRLYGGLANTAQTTLERSPDQTEIALFWAYDRTDTFRPYGQLLEIAVNVALDQATSMLTNAKLIASLSLSMADAVICAWKEKYDIVQPRPWDLITGSFSDTDGSALTVRDPNWQSLLSSINGVQSPPFPDFLSGHSVMGGTFASVMSHFFGDNLTFDATSQELPGVVRSFFGFIDAGGVERNSFYEAGLEDAISRVYGGVHIREACEDSFAVGLNVGAAVVQNLWAST